MGLFSFAGDMGSVAAAANTAKIAKLNQQQIVLQQEQLELERATQSREHQFRLATDAKYRNWWEERVSRERQSLLAIEQQRQQIAQVERELARADQERRSHRTRTIWWVIGIILVPYVVVWLPYTRKRLTGWPYWLLAAWAAFLIIRVFVDGASGS